MVNSKKPPARLSPLECELCSHNEKCCYGQIRDELYRLSLSIRFEDCALYNGGDVICADLVTKGTTAAKS